MAVPRICPGCRRRVTGRCDRCDRGTSAPRVVAKKLGYGRREAQRRADTVAAWVRLHGWNCPGWQREAHPSTDLTADHITPIQLGGPQGGPLTVLCQPCNSARGAKLPTIAVAGLSVVLVAGPPCGGKSSFLAAHAGPDDLIVDYDAIAIALQPGGISHGHRDLHRPFVCEARDAVLDRLMLGNHGIRRAWIINVAETRAKRDRYRQRYGAHVVLVMTPEDVCLSRALAERPAAWPTYIARWFKAYEADERDEIVRGYEP